MPKGRGLYKSGRGRKTFARTSRANITMLPQPLLSSYAYDQ